MRVNVEFEFNSRLAAQAFVEECHSAEVEGLSIDATMPRYPQATVFLRPRNARILREEPRTINDSSGGHSVVF